MKKKLIGSLLMGLLIASIFSNCTVEVKVETLVYGEGFVSNIDCFQGSSNPHRVLFENKSDETLTVKYSITYTNDQNAYNGIVEPTWSSVTYYITIARDATNDINTNLGSSSFNYAHVWCRAQNSANTKYVIFSVFLSKADNMEYDVTISKGK